MGRWAALWLCHLYGKLDPRPFSPSTSGAAIVNGVVLELELPDGVMDAPRCTCNDYAQGRRAVADAGRWAAPAYCLRDTAS
jgi:hypothetical protein